MATHHLIWNICFCFVYWKKLNKKTWYIFYKSALGHTFTGVWLMHTHGIFKTHRNASWETEYRWTKSQADKMDALLSLICNYARFLYVYWIASKSAHLDGCRCCLDSDFTQNPLCADHAHWSCLWAIACEMPQTGGLLCVLKNTIIKKKKVR